MGPSVRKPFQGLRNIIRFNWPFYVTGLFLVVAGLALYFSATAPLRIIAGIFALLVFLPMLLSLLVSWYVYDHSGLYSLDWLPEPGTDCTGTIMNIHAGFDEFSHLLEEKFPLASLELYDFYDPEKHTEPSIKRARKSMPPRPGTTAIRDTGYPFCKESAERIFLLFAAHEIRDRQERIQLFSALKSSLARGGRIIVLEHLRDLPNFIAFSIGFFHFLSLKEWKAGFRASGLQLRSHIKYTPFVNIFILEPHADPL